MDAKVTWQEKLAFMGVAGGGHPVQMDSLASENAVTPMEMIALSLAGCTAMDVISILDKKRQNVTGFEVKIHGDRASDHPKVFVKAVVTYVVTGRGVDEGALLRAIELSLTKYCSVHAMLDETFPIESGYEIYEDQGNGKAVLVKEGKY
jgi:putative redox protein